MPPRILGLHHVTATVDDAQSDLDFCIELLGLRLVKKTVNFDNHHVYHFYYGNHAGTPGTIWATFPYKGHGVRTGIKGAGQVVTTAFSVPVGSLEAWRTRFRTAAVVSTDIEEQFGEAAIAFNDPSGLRFELVAASGDTRSPWAAIVPKDEAIRGIHSVTMLVRQAPPSIAFLSDVLGWTVAGTQGARTRMAAGGTTPGHFIDIVEDASAPAAVNGIGTVHHVAMAISSDEEQSALREDLLARGVRVTEIRDRNYFRSIYFREPGGVLYEVATVQPGFAVDESADALGRALKLPEWEEGHRADIEAHLAPIRYR
jgi:glyoxalase family protein